MNYRDTWGWPNLPVEQVDRDDIATMYSFGHLDGVGSGLVRWADQLWYAKRFEHRSTHYWLVRLTPEQQEYAERYGRTWAEFFHSGMSWQADGRRAPKADGIYAVRPTPNYLTYTDEGRRRFDELFPSRPEPDEGAEVVGWFDEW